MEGQISMFEALGEYETPTLSTESLYDGLVAWIADADCYTREIGDEGPLAKVVCMARKVRFRQIGKSLFWDTIDGGNFMGGTWARETVFAGKPTKADIERAALNHLPDYLRRRITPDTPVIVE